MQILLERHVDVRARIPVVWRAVDAWRLMFCDDDFDDLFRTHKAERVMVTVSHKFTEGCYSLHVYDSSVVVVWAGHERSLCLLSRAHQLAQALTKGGLRTVYFTVEAV